MVSPQEASALSLATWASLGLSLGLQVGFSGGPDPLKSTELHECCLAGFNLVGRRIFIPEFDPVCPWDGSSACCQLLPLRWASVGPKCSETFLVVPGSACNGDFDC